MLKRVFGLSKNKLTAAEGVGTDSLFPSKDHSYFITTIVKGSFLKRGVFNAEAKAAVRDTALAQIYRFLHSKDGEKLFKPGVRYMDPEVRNLPELLGADVNLPVDSSKFTHRVGWILQFRMRGDNRRCKYGMLVVTSEGYGDPVTQPYPDAMPTPEVMANITNLMANVNGKVHCIHCYTDKIIVQVTLNEPLSVTEIVARFNDTVTD